MKNLKIAALLLIVVLSAIAPSFTEPPIDVGNDGSSTSGTSTLVRGGPSSDLFTSEPVFCWGATKVVFHLSATTGSDSGTTVQVSQDNITWFKATDGALGTASAGLVTQDGYAASDSLSGTFDRTIELWPTYAEGISYKFARLALRAEVGTTITGLAVNAIPIFITGSGEGMARVYERDF